jgi:hypothetical protein
MLHGALQGAVTAGAFYEAGNLAQVNNWGSGSLNWKTMLAHGVAGGTSNVLLSGSFKNGFISSAVADSVAGSSSNVALGALEHAGAGAASSWLTGGDATQGAINGAAGYLFNDIFHADDYATSLASCRQNPGGSGCSTILSMQGTHSTPLTQGDGSNTNGVIANVNDQNQIVSFTITDAQNQPTLIMQPSDYYTKYLPVVNAGSSFWVFTANNSPEYALLGSNAATDFANGQWAQGVGNLGQMFSNGAYWRDMGIGMTVALGASLPSNVETPSSLGNVGSTAADSGVPPVATTVDQEVADLGYNENSISHIFQDKHVLDPLVSQFGSQESALLAMQNEAQQAITPGAYQTGSWVSIKVGGIPVAVKGAFVNGTFRISTATMRPF